MVESPEVATMGGHEDIEMQSQATDGVDQRTYGAEIRSYRDPVLCYAGPLIFGELSETERNEFIKSLASYRLHDNIRTGCVVFMYGAVGITVLTFSHGSSGKSYGKAPRGESC